MQQHFKNFIEKKHLLFSFANKKTKTLKNIKWALLLLAVLIMGKGWAATETLTCSLGTVVGTTMTFNTSNFTVVHSKGTDANFAAYTPWRVYTNNTVTITKGIGVSTITKITLKATSAAYATAANGTFAVTGGGSASAVVSGNDLIITITGTATSIVIDPSAQTRWNSIDIEYTPAVATPTISTTGTPLSAVNTTYGSNSSNTTFNVSGANMTAGISVTPPSGFQVSTVSDFSSNVGTNSSPITVGAAGTIASTPIYVRIPATTAAGSYSGNIVLASSGATGVNVATVSSTVSTKNLTITGLSASNKVYNGTTAVSVAGTPAFSGLVNGESFSPTGSVSWDFPNASVENGKTLSRTGSYSDPSANYTVTQPSLTADITVKALTITANDVSKPQGTTLTGGAGFTSFSSSGLENGETIGSVTLSYGSAGAATGDGNVPGVYTNQVTPSLPIGGSFSTSNYSISYVLGTITVTAVSTPTFNVSALSDFGNQCYGTCSAEKSFTITGNSLTSADVVVTALSGYTICATSGGTFTSSLTFTQGGGSFSQTIYVKFCPAVAQSYNGNIVVSGGEASDENVAVTGIGVNSSPIIVNPSHASVTGTSATLGGEISSIGCSDVTERGIYYSTTSGFADGAGTKVSSIGTFSTGVFTENVSGLNTGTTYYYKAFATNNGGTVYTSQNSFTTSTPIITITGSVSSFDGQAISTTSANKTYSVSGANLVADISLTAPVGFEISTAAGSGFGSAITLNQTGGTVSSTTIYVRFSPTSVQAYSGNISHSSTGASTQNVAVSGNGTISAPVATAATSVGTSTFTANWELVGGSSGYELDVYTKSGSGTTDDFQGFESSTLFPSGYSGWAGDGYVTGTTPANARTGSNYAGLNATNKYIQTPLITNPYSITFYYRTSASTAAHTVRLQYSSNGSSWSDAAVIISTNPSSVDYAVSTSSLNLTGDYYLRWIMTAKSSGSIYFDDVTITTGSPLSEVPIANSPFTINGGSVSSKDISGLSSATNYYYKVRAVKDAAQSANSNEIEVTTLTVATPEINIKGNNTSIASGSVVPALDNHTDFGSVDVSSGTLTRTFTIENLGTADLNLTSGSPFVSISGADAADFSVTSIPSTPIASLGSTTFQITFNPSAIGTRSATISIASDDSDENPYTFAIQGTGINSIQSDIIVDGAYGYSSNIDYASYQGNPASNTSNSIGVLKFNIRDGGGSADSDALTTELNSITFNVTNITNIRSAALFGGGSQTTMLNNSPTINTGAGTITFTGLSGVNVTADDDGTKSITLRVSFLTTVTDNQQLQFTIASATANTSGSGFASANAGGAVSSTTGDINRIEVTATKLGFSVQPVNSSINVNLPAFTIATMDANNNTDLDASASVSITSSGTGLTAVNPYSLTSGALSISNVSFSDAQNDITLTATASGLTDGISTIFTISAVVIPANSYRTIGAGTWPNSSTATWERYVGGVWTSASAPTAATINVLYIRNAVTSNAAFAAPAPGSYVVIESGGVFNVGHNCTFASMEVKDGGVLNITSPGATVAATGNITVESGGKIVINSATLNNADNFWAGTENFKNGSTLEIQNWDWNSSSGEERLIDNINTISTNDDGYYFGNIVINATLVEKAFILIGNTGTYKLLQNNLTVNLGATSTYNVILTNVNANAEIGGDVIAMSKTFSFGAVSASNLVHAVKGNIISSGGILNLNQVSAGAASVIVNVDGNVDIPSGSSLISSDAGCKLVFSKSGTQTLSIAGTLGTNVAFEVASSSTTQLIGQNLDLSNASNKLTVLTGGTLEFNNYDIVGFGDFILDASGTLKITSVDGVNASGNNTGNVQCTGTRTYSQTGFYHYVGSSTPQSTGTAMTSGSTAKQIVINKTNPTDVVNLTQSTGTTSKLEINQGIFAESLTAQITGSGDLIMTSGEYRMPILATTLPQLSGTYTLTGGTIHLNGGVGTQTLKGNMDYYSLMFSGGGTKNISIAITDIGDNSTINQGLVTIKDDNTVLDIQNSGFSGNAGLTMMNNSTFRTRRVSASLPELEGLYTMTSGTVELYGSESTQNHTLRGTDGSGNRIIYNNLELNANAANVANNDANIIIGSGFTVKGTMNVNSPTCLRVASTYNIDGVGTFNVNSGATLKYGSADGITASSNAGNIRTSTRNFSNTASYGFAGTLNQVTGDGLPSSMINIYMDKTNANATVTLTNPIAIETALVMNQGHIITGSNLLELGNSTTNKGSLTYTTGYVIGKMRRWFDGTNSGNSTGLFPLAIDESGLKNRNVIVEYSTAASTGGSLTTEWVANAMGTAGLPILTENTGGCTFDITSSSQQGYWKIDNAPGTLTDGLYSISLSGEGVNVITDYSKLSLLKREGTGNWFCPGTHNVPSGSNGNPSISRAGVSGWSNFGFGGGDPNVLPIELISFTAHCQNDLVKINWTTASEVNNSHFVLQRSLMDNQWIDITTINGQGNSSTNVNYSFVDKNSYQNSMYRLIQVDFDGKKTFFNPISVQCSENKISNNMMIYPNPFNGELNITLDNTDYKSVTLEIIDMNGKIILSENFSEETQIQLSTAHIQRGVYTLRIITDTKTEVFKVVKQ